MAASRGSTSVQPGDKMALVDGWTLHGSNKNETS